MRLLLQRVKQADVSVEGKLHASIGCGLLVLAGFGAEETGPSDVRQTPPPCDPAATRILDKLLGLRVFPDHKGKMNLDLEAFGGEVLLVSQFTLYADCRKGLRPSFHLAAKPEAARQAYHTLEEQLRDRLGERLKTGIFGASMDVSLINWGPVTIMLDTEVLSGQRP